MPAAMPVALTPLGLVQYDALTRAANFTEFSKGGGVTGLEQIHNGIHWDAGCTGFFLEQALTAFDPLFMAHHANVDRLWAYWQTLRPEHSIFLTPYPGRARFSTPANTTIDANSPLQPFFHRGGGFHSTASVRSIWDLGYGYEGLEWWLNRPVEETRQRVVNIVNRLSPASRGSRRRRRRRVGVDAILCHRLARRGAGRAPLPGGRLRRRQEGGQPRHAPPARGPGPDGLWAGPRDRRRRHARPL